MEIKGTRTYITMEVGSHKIKRRIEIKTMVRNALIVINFIIS